MKAFLLVLISITFSAYTFSQPAWSAYGGIPNSATRSAIIDASNNKWVAMYGGGISKFKPDETFDNYNSSNSGLPENFIQCVSLDNAGNKWIGTTNAGAVLYDGSTWTSYSTSNGMPGNQVNCIAIDASNNKWFGINLNGITKFDGTIFTTYNTGNSSLPNNNVNCITIDASGNKWIGTYGGLAKFDGTTWTIYTTGNSGLAHDQVYSVIFENPTTIWIGTGGGLCKFDGGSSWVTYHTGNSGLPYNYVNCVAIDQDGTKWIGTTQGGMAEFDGLSSWTVYNTSNSDIPGIDVRDIDVDSDNNLWVCTNDGGFAFYGEIPFVDPSDATLSDLRVGGVTVAGFSPSVFDYYITLPYGTVTAPPVTATLNNINASMTITDATVLPGSATVVTLSENAANSLVYTVYFTIAPPGTDATLSDLKVDGTTVAGFSPTTYSYNVALPYGTTIVPTVTATTNDVNANAIVNDAAGLPGATTVVVTAEDGTTSLTYTINFTVASPNNDATLSDLKVDGTTVAGFSPATYSYNMALPYGTTIVPTVTATTNDVNANAIVNDAAGLPGATTVVVTAEDGTTSLTYTINFSVETSVFIIDPSELSVFPNPSDGIFYLKCQRITGIKVRDISGRIILSRNSLINQSVDLSAYESGLYILQVDIAGESVYYNILKK